MVSADWPKHAKLEKKAFVVTDGEDTASSQSLSRLSPLTGGEWSDRVFTRDPW